MRTNTDTLPVEKTGKSHVLRRFPDHWAAVITIFDENEEFRSLCNEYGLALGALSRVEGSPGSRERNIRDEYMAIILELESEIRNQIDVHTLPVNSSENRLGPFYGR